MVQLEKCRITLEGCNAVVQELRPVKLVYPGLHDTVSEPEPEFIYKGALRELEGMDNFDIRTVKLSVVRIGQEE
jgi:hypothetical protein